MENTANHITLTGTLASLPEYSHQNHERRFFRFLLAVERLSGTEDLLPVLAAEDVLEQAELFEGERFTIEGQIRKNKTRLARRLRQDAFTRTAEETSFAPEPAEDDLSITKKKSFYFRPMTREEAVLQMNLLEHSFFAFRDEDNGGSFAVVYRRNDGGYGLIDDAK